MDYPNLLGIHGYVGSGKDTVAFLITNDVPTYLTYAFAWPIKEAVKIIFGFTDADLNDRELKDKVNEFWGITPIRSVQLLGTEYGRNMICEDIWIRRAKQQMEKNLAENYGTIISDVRYENEARFIRENGGRIIHVIRKVDRSQPRFNHSSENGIQRMPEDLVIHNDGTVSDLINTVRSTLHILREEFIWQRDSRLNNS